MANDYPIESLLRPPFELYGAAVCFSGAVIAALSPETLMVVDQVAWAVAGGFIVRGSMRTAGAMRIIRYQRGLVRVPNFVMQSKQIPCSRKKLFLGRGFRWYQYHTQRLADVEKLPVYAKPGHLYEAARDFENNHGERNALTRLIARLTSSNSRFNPVRPLPPVGGSPELHAVGMLEGEKNVFLDQGERNGHTLVLGTTRVGKTRLLDVLVRQDIANGDVVIVFDPKGDGELFRNMYAEAVRCGREDNFFFFHLGYPEISARYNPVGNFQRVTEISSRIAGQLPGEGQSAAFREFVWRYVNVIAKTLTALGRRADYQQIKFYGEDIEPLFIDYMVHYLQSENHRNGQWAEDVADYVAKYDSREEGFKPSRGMGEREAKTLALLRYFREHEIEDFIAHSLIKTIEYEKGYLDKLVGSLLPLMEKLCTGKTAELLSPDYTDIDDPRPIFDWQEVIRTGGIVYVGLDALSDPEVAAAVGNSMLADLTATSGNIYKEGVNVGLPTTIERRVCLHADEFNELARDEFIPMVNKAGGAGFMVTAYTQTFSDIIVRLGSEAKAGQVSGNFNTVVMLRVRELETAQKLTEQLKQVEISHLMSVSRSSDSSNPDDKVHFTSSHEQRETTQRVDLITPNDLISLPKGQAFCLLEGGKPYKIRIPLPASTDLADIPSNFRDIAGKMQSRYTTSENWYAF